MNLTMNVRPVFDFRHRGPGWLTDAGCTMVAIDYSHIGQVRLLLIVVGPLALAFGFQTPANNSAQAGGGHV